MRIRLAALCGLALLIAGCAGFGGLRDSVRVTVSDIQVLDSTLLEHLYLVTLRVQNRDDQPIAIHGGAFDLAINGRDFGSGVSDERITVPGYSDAQIRVQMVSTLFDMLRLIEGLRLGSATALNYEISGRLSLEDSFAALRFRESGEIALPRGNAGRAVD